MFLSIQLEEYHENKNISKYLFYTTLYVKDGFTNIL